MRSAVHVATEHMEQVALFAWARQVAKAHPELRLLYAVPNGAALAGRSLRSPSGKAVRISAEAMRLRAEGLKPGVPDTCLPVARGAFHGLYIEMKRRKGGVLSAEQKEWLSALAEQGYCALCCAGWDAARDAIVTYLAGGDPR